MSRRTGGRVAVVAVSAAVLAVFALASVAVAKSVSDDRDQIVLTGTLRVPSGESVGTAVILNGPASIDGVVTRTLVVLNGRTEISGRVGEDVVVVNGTVVVRSGAEVGGNLYSRETATIEDGGVVRGEIHGVPTRFDLRGVGLAGRFAWWFGYSISTLILGLLLLAFTPSLDAALLEAVRDRIGAGFGFGAAVFFLVPIAGVVFLVIIVAIPLGVFVLLALALLYTVGYVAGAHGIGRLIVRPPSSRFAAFLAGWGVLRLVGLIPFAGGFTWFVVSILGLGLLTVAARRGAPVEGPTPIPPPPAPA